LPCILYLVIWVICITITGSISLRVVPEGIIHAIVSASIMTWFFEIYLLLKFAFP
jgi:hypothetical protein